MARTSGKIVATYDYRDESGKLLYQVVRYHPKDFRFRRPMGQGWRWSLGMVRRVPYRLPELLSAPGERVWIVEGEKDVDSLRAIGLTATTNSGGGGRGKWPRSHNRFLRGRDVVILPDNDSVGQAHAEDVAQSLGRFAAAIRIVALPGLDHKGDVTDWLESGRSKDDLLALVASAGLADTRLPPFEFAESIDADLIWCWHVAPAIVRVLKDTDLSAQEKLLLIIHRLPFRHQKEVLKQDALSAIMGLTVRRIKQMVASLRKRGKLPHGPRSR